MRLSVLIPTLDQRAHLLKRLLDILCPQTTDEVEVLLETDKGEAHIGTKRNKLIAKAQGDYVCFVDDDDRVSGDYIPRILGAIQTNPDCVGIEGIYTCHSIKKQFYASLKYKNWYEDKTGYFRCPNHLNPTRKTLAAKVLFPEKSWGEDVDYSLRLLPHLKTEVYLAGPIYFYDYNQTNFRGRQAKFPPV